jgi:hypothetical protein
VSICEHTSAHVRGGADICAGEGEGPAGVGSISGVQRQRRQSARLPLGPLTPVCTVGRLVMRVVLVCVVCVGRSSLASPFRASLFFSCWYEWRMAWVLACSGPHCCSAITTDSRYECITPSHCPRCSCLTTMLWYSYGTIETLLRCCSGAVKALLRRYSGGIQTILSSYLLDRHVVVRDGEDGRFLARPPPAAACCCCVSICTFVLVKQGN